MTRKIGYILLFIFNISFANITLPSVFSDHMVLQQKQDIKLWGWANPDEEVTIKPSWNNQVYKVKANNQADWELFITTPSYGGPYTITFTGYNEIVLNDIMIGEVWLCSGQSNMEMTPAWGIKNKDEIEKTNKVNIRFFTVPKISAQFPQDNCHAKWEVCSPETMKNSSAVAYFFAKGLQVKLNNVPIGLMISAWGGTPIEIWMPEETIAKDSILLQSAKELTPVPWGPIEPARAFNSMINPLIGYKIAGALWYQGESNVGANNYDKTLSALINSWRTAWDATFPFYYVQIAPYQYGEDHFGGAVIRNSQRKVLDQTKNTGMVVIDDVSTSDDIHPKDKKSVGFRLANLALVKHYKAFDEMVNGPLFEKVFFENGKAIVHFKYSDGLYIKTDQSFFEIAGEDKIFWPAKAKVKTNNIVLSSKKVNDPKYIRFLWKNTAQSNVYNSANLPASCFTTME